MEGFFVKGDVYDPFVGDKNTANRCYYSCLPIRWDALKPDPLYKLLHHSDCDGGIAAEDCGPIADSLELLLPALKDAGDGGGHIGSYHDKTAQFIKGLRLATELGENVIFH
jgi:hypothetical protein